MEQGKDLDRKHQTGQHAGNQAFPGVALPHAAVGFPPVARFIAQAAQHGISHGAQLRACNQAADDTGQQHEQQRIEDEETNKQLEALHARLEAIKAGQITEEK